MLSKGYPTRTMELFYKKEFTPLLAMLKEYYLDKKAKALHRKQFASVLSEIRAYYAFKHIDDLEWFLNDLKNQKEPILFYDSIGLDYSYKTIYNTGYLSGNYQRIMIPLDTLLADAVSDSGRLTLPAYLV